MKNKILYTLLFISIAATFTFYDFMLNLKEVYAYAFTMIMMLISSILYINTDKGSKKLKFLKESIGELRVINWTKKSDVISSTLVVLGIIIVSTLIIWFFDITIYKFISSNLH